MGTTYQAQVEVFFEKTDYHGDMWQAVSRWELQKDYDFAMAWGEVADDGWPKVERFRWPPEYPLIIGEGLEDRKLGGDAYEQKKCGDGVLLALLEVPDPGPWFLELREHVRRLIAAGYKVRVLTWGE